MASKKVTYSSLKEVLGFFAENPQGELVCIEDNRTNGIAKNDMIKIKTITDSDYFRFVGLAWHNSRNNDGSPVSLEILDLDMEWQEVRQTYSFLEAYADCLATGQKYQLLNDWGDTIFIYKDSELVVFSADDFGNVTLDNKWVKFND